MRVRRALRSFLLDTAGHVGVPSRVEHGRESGDVGGEVKWQAVGVERLARQQHLVFRRCVPPRTKNTMKVQVKGHTPCRFK